MIIIMIIIIIMQTITKVTQNLAWLDEKVIHWEFCKRLEFDLTDKWYMHKLESVLENETHKILWDFEIQTDYLIPAIRKDLVLISKV